jgi:16S rRNA C967 or C1407 C5-methylase (RsmB/RsmF family)/NOL1/NOP2/fmu family ribosome biogenesis protein
MTAFPEAFAGRGLPDGLLAALDGEAPVSVRFNPFKATEKPTGLRQVPWCRWGYYLDARPQFSLDPAWHAGAYYVQEASSMFVGYLLEHLLERSASARVLDLCAAPGGKATLLSTLVGLEGLVVANDPIHARAQALADNVARWGLGNVAVTCNDPSHFASLEGWFDVVLVDAPCSGEGMFRRHPEARAEWSESNVELCARRQRRILAEVWSALRPGGYLIYSTCTFNRAENEENVEWLLREHGGELVDVEAPEGVERSDFGYRFWPHRIEGEGFFAAAVRKDDGRTRANLHKPRREALEDAPRDVVRELGRWVEQPEFMRFAQAGDNFYGYYDSRYHDIRTVAGRLSVIYSGVRMGQVFKGRLKPDHPLALFHGLRAEAVELSPEQALTYLRKGDVSPEPLAEGMNLVACGGHRIGWAKRIGARVNNLYPSNLRVLAPKCKC